MSSPSVKLPAVDSLDSLKAVEPNPRRPISPLAKLPHVVEAVSHSAKQSQQNDVSTEVMEPKGDLSCCGNESTVPRSRTISYKKLGRDGAMRSLRDLCDPLRKDTTSSQFIYESKRFSQTPEVSSAAPPSRMSSAIHRTKTSRKARRTRADLTLSSNVEDIKHYRKSMQSPSTLLELTKERPTHNQPSVFNLNTSATLQQEQTITKTNPFHTLCDDVMVALGDFDSAMRKFFAWKDNLLKQEIGSSMKFHVVMMCSNMLRSQSDLSQLIFEMVKTIKVYSSQWSDKFNCIIELEEEHARQCRAFDILIRKLEQMHSQLNRFRGAKRVFLWEYLTKKLIRKKEKEEADELAKSEEKDSECEKEKEKNDYEEE
ncbi:hypothetical protein BKA69DRAFT_396644 [Paraphysoderma sedebokerense]|nr:hypothetical protein BKA69DRAFT_396644 [Paraphysoderma sedebokerense]